MKAKECMFAWNPNSNEVEVGAWPDEFGWSGKYMMTAGATYTRIHDMTHDQLVAYMYIEAIHLIIRDKVDPISVHNAFSNIEEYRDGWLRICLHRLPNKALDRIVTNANRDR